MGDGGVKAAEATSRNTHATVAALLGAESGVRRVLDIPCGEGAFLARLATAGYAPHGADIQQMLKVGGVPFTPADMNEPLPFADGAFDEKPTIHSPSKPSASIGSSPTAPTLTAQLQMPTKPTMLPLSSTVLPYPTVTIPDVPVWSDPSFVGTAPDAIHTISMDEYLAMLTSTYNNYASAMPRLVQSNWRAWYSTMLQDHPMVATLQGILTSYFNTGGAAYR